MRIDHEAVLNRWANGETGETIRRALKIESYSSVIWVITEARAKGDPRAVKRPRGEAFRNAMKADIGVWKRRRRIAKLPVDPAQIEAAIRSHNGPITVLPPGYHQGHVPKALRDINY